MIKIILQNPLDNAQTIDYDIEPNDTQLAQDWTVAFEEIVDSHRGIVKDFCFMGFPRTHRTMGVICEELNAAVRLINNFHRTEIWHKAGLEPYMISDHYTPDAVMWSDEFYPTGWEEGIEDWWRSPALRIKEQVMNTLHNHFERLQGSVEEPSPYWSLATPAVKEAIGKLNIACHEMESLAIGLRRARVDYKLLCPSQIVNYQSAPRYNLTDEHRSGFNASYDRRLGHVYMHWCQIGKTLFEVWRDEGAPELTAVPYTATIGGTCELVNQLQYYSGEFNIEWGRDVTVADSDWHRGENARFKDWLTQNGVDWTDPQWSLGYLNIGEVKLKESFGTDVPEDLWAILSEHLDVKGVEINGKTRLYDEKGRTIA